MRKETSRHRPVFPLGTVLFPAGELSLRIFEPRYVDMVSRCSRNGHGFVVVAIKSGSEAGEPAIPYDLGTEVEISDWDKDQEGLLVIECQGKARVELSTTWLQEDGLRLAEVRELAPELPDAVPQEFQSLWAVLARFGLEPVSEEQQTASWLGGRLVERIPMSLPQKQELLGIDDSLARLAEINRQLVGFMKA